METGPKPTPESKEQLPEQEINLLGEVFGLFRTQRNGNLIYRSEQNFARLGTKERITSEKELHQMMFLKGMPLPEILSEGTYKQYEYYIEKSIGDKHFGSLFYEQYAKQGEIEQALFEQFLTITKQYLEAQISTTAGPSSKEDVALALNLEKVCQNYPELSSAIRARFDEVMERVEVFPSALTQGDFNAFNIFPKGVIDLEFAFYGPLPYDAATVLVHVDNFDPFEGNELKRNYRFSTQQRQTYLAMVDQTYNTHNLPPLSKYMKEFDLLRTLRSAGPSKHTNLHAFILNRLKVQLD